MRLAAQACAVYLAALHALNSGHYSTAVRAHAALVLGAYLTISALVALIG